MKKQEKTEKTQLRQNQLQDLLDKIHKDAQAQRISLEQTIESNLREAILTETKSEQKLFSEQYSRFNRIKKGTAQHEDIEYVLNNRAASIDKMPARVREEMHKNTDAFVKAMESATPAIAYVYEKGTGSPDIIFPMSKKDKEGVVGKYVYDAVKEGLDKKTIRYSEITYDNGCVALRITHHGYKAEILSRFLNGFFLDSYAPVVFRPASDPGRIDLLGKAEGQDAGKKPEADAYSPKIDNSDKAGQKYYVTDLLKRFKLSTGSLYNAMKNLKFEKNFEGNKRVFSETEVTSLDSYLNKQEQAQPAEGAVKADAVQEIQQQESGKQEQYLTIEEVAKQLELSRSWVWRRIDKQDIPGAVKKDGRIYVPASSVEHFKNQHPRMNMVYKGRKGGE